EGLVKCMQANGDKSGPVALLNGSPTDNNATLFKQGYEKAIKDAGYSIAADQSVPDWDNTKAGTIFEQMYTKANGNFVGVAETNEKVKSVVRKAQAIFKDNVKDVVADGCTTADKLCTTAALKQACQENGIG